MLLAANLRRDSRLQGDRSAVAVSLPLVVAAAPDNLKRLLRQQFGIALGSRRPKARANDNENAQP
jgi:hypothetical protein